MGLTPTLCRGDSLENIVWIYIIELYETVMTIGNKNTPILELHTNFRPINILQPRKTFTVIQIEMGASEASPCMRAIARILVPRNLRGLIMTGKMTS